MRKWITKTSKVVYKNKWLQFIEDNVLRPDGKEGIYGYLDRGPAIFVIAKDKGDSIFLIKEY